MLDSKQCTRCLKVKSCDNFYLQTNRKHRCTTCKECKKEVLNLRIQRDPERHKARVKIWNEGFKHYRKNSRLLRLYGISTQEKEDMFKAQKGLCRVCGKPGKLVVDHDHITGKVRGLLHSVCNVVIGLIKEDFNTALGIAKYIQEHKDIV